MFKLMAIRYCLFLLAVSKCVSSDDGDNGDANNDSNGDGEMKQ